MKASTNKLDRAIEPGAQEALDLFQEAARRVPAYKDFLSKARINPEKVRTTNDFAVVPPVDKANYLTKYPLAELCWDGVLFGSEMISVSSGSTGDPFFWPRGDSQDEEGAWMHEQFFTKVFRAHKKSTLVVVCFSMGTWIAGSFTTSSAIRLARKDYPINVVTPGIEKEEALKAIRNLSSQYEQVLLAGYPPFVKDILDAGSFYGIDWEQLQMRFLFAGENFGEDWRDHVLEVGGSGNPYYDSLSVYGTADAAILGNETPVSIAVRRLFNENPALLEQHFGTQVLPSLMQYYPDRRYFESVGGELVFTARAGIPLIRYNIHDTGGLFSFNEILTPIIEQFTDVAATNKIDPTEWRLPFVFIHGRKDFTTTLYAVLIYPENIKAALLDERVRNLVTGKFTMSTKYYSDMDQYLEVNVELAQGRVSKPGEVDLITKILIEELTTLNAEYKKLRASVGVKATPQVQLIEYGNKDYFGPGAKHRWKRQ